MNVLEKKAYTKLEEASEAITESLSELKDSYAALDNFPTARHDILALIEQTQKLKNDLELIKDNFNAKLSSIN